MVYEKKCAECGKVIDFGGEDKGDLPENAIEFDDNIYCKECVRKFVEFGTGEVVEKVNSLEESVEMIEEELGIVEDGQ